MGSHFSRMTNQSRSSESGSIIGIGPSHFREVAQNVARLCE
jgi:hypothetical protein